jgi:uncharacterized lipoprotein YddW (UPF0748 family)
MKILLLAALLLAVANAQIRAVWIPIRYRDSDENMVKQTLTTLKGFGINRVYVDVWNNGAVTFKSPSYNAFTGFTNTRDSFSWYVNAARSLGMQIFAWFEYGLMSKYNGYDAPFAKVAKDKGLEVGVANGFTWMHPTKAAPFLAGIMIDALKYGITGVQLDDHFCFPPSLPGSNANVLTEAAKDVVKRVKAAVPNAYISLSPSPESHHLTVCNARWIDWASAGIFDEYAPQMYQLQPASVIKETEATLAKLSRAPKKPFVVGWAIDHAGPSMSSSDAQTMAKWIKSKGLGFSVWYAKGVVENYGSQLKAIWG